MWRMIQQHPTVAHERLLWMLEAFKGCLALPHADAVCLNDGGKHELEIADWHASQLIDRAV